MFVCVHPDKRERKKGERKLDFHFWCAAALCCSKQGLGASDQPLHQFTGTVEGLLSRSLSLSLLSPFSLCHISSVSPLPSPLPFFLLQYEPLLTLMKRHVLCDSLSPTNMRDGGEMMEVE